MIDDQLSHQIKLMVNQAISEIRPWVYGHIASYDSQTHRVRLVLPSMRDENNNPSYSSWLPIGATYAFNGAGVQWAPIGGATLQNPTAGEQCMMLINERGLGFAAVPCMFWNQSVTPPGAGTLQPGELLIQTKTGTQVYLRQNGDVLINSPTGNVTVIGGIVTVTARTVAQIVAPAVKLCGALTDALQAFCTTAFYTWAVAHTHNDPQGGVTSPPVQPAPGNSLTTITTGE